VVKGVRCKENDKRCKVINEQIASCPRNDEWGDAMTSGSAMASVLVIAKNEAIPRKSKNTRVRVQE
jgi:hypothetical protein